ncbi:hypothetical protein [Turneriella parva]|uniref:hypothetical protein n=1 Tax=Turneriella parva TaxID=29510 RepID=UPI0005A50788|nr:hypothetical protein [Turneriella parva]
MRRLFFVLGSLQSETKAPELEISDVANGDDNHHFGGAARGLVLESGVSRVNALRVFEWRVGLHGFCKRSIDTGGGWLDSMS